MERLTNIWLTQTHRGGTHWTERLTNIDTKGGTHLTERLTNIWLPLRVTGWGRTGRKD